jgi:phosphate:Na+ symporter
VTFLDFTVVLGGLAIFLHGLSLTKEGLQIVAGDKLRSILFALSNNRVVGLFSGAVVTSILQSSTATTVMLVGFAASALMTLPQAMAVLLGADIGTTVTVQLISFRLSTYALGIVAGGTLIRLLSKKRRNRYIGQVLLGFGLLFFGMKLMGDGTLPLRESPLFNDALVYLGNRAFAGIAGAAIATVLMQGSAPTIGLLIAMSAAGSMSLAAALPMVLGANIGTTLTPILAAANAPAEGKRVAIAHAVFKVFGVALFLPFLDYFAQLVTLTAETVPRQVANAHTLFNVFNSLLFLPFTKLGATFITRYYQPEEEAEVFKPRYLDPRAIESPALAFGNARRELFRMADIANDMLKDFMRAMDENDADLLADIESRDDKVDILNREIRFYLAKIGQEAMTPEQADQQLELISLSNEIENVGDTVMKNLVPLAKKKVHHGLAFSAQGFAELKEFHGKVCENFDLALNAFSSADEQIARKVLRHKTALIDIESELKEKHIARLNQGLRESLETSSVHLDLLAYLRRVNDSVGSLAEAVLKRIEDRPKSE